MDAAEGGLFYIGLWGHSALLAARKSADIEDFNMRKIVVLNRVSIDGFFASLNQKSWGMDWFVQDPAVDKAAHALIAGDSPPDTLILGGITVGDLNDPGHPG
ncbi:MAG: hypothetical protein ABIV92_12720 [Thermoflexales bacterium]